MVVQGVERLDVEQKVQTRTLASVEEDRHRLLQVSGAGRGRHCTWKDLVCNDSQGFEKYYAAAEDLIKEIGARPHLGKFCETFDAEDLASLHQGSFTTFMNLVGRHDPDRKFASDFTRRPFGRLK